MNHAALVIHSFSYPFIQNVALFVHDALRDRFGPDTPLLICDSVDDAQHEDGAIVFLIGENLPAFRRRPGCHYVYLNFSVVTVLGQPWETGLNGRRAIRNKWKMLKRNLASVDVLLDYYPPQTRVLQRKLRAPVFGFAVASTPTRDYVSMADRQYDVCFVGSLNDRRRSVCEAIQSAGHTLSPSKDIVIEDATAQSRLCLNVHSVKSHHFETPRFVAALSSGTPVVSEPSFASDTIIDREFVFEGDREHLPSVVEDLLSRPDKLEEIGQGAYQWYKEQYVPEAKALWRATLGAVQECLVQSDRRAGT